MNHDTQSAAARGEPIDGRVAFADALRHSLAHALQARTRELCFVDPDFESWPLDDPAVLGALGAWARLPERRLIVVAASFEAMPRRFARFTEWRRTWAHVVEAHVTEVEPSQIPTLLLAGEASLMLADRQRWRGHGLTSDKEVADWREVVDVLLQRSEPGFGANTLGL
ncbi:MAG: hypothetical protein OEU94_12720 [Aquincola sp.]|nr:hypothetical protein [Aquincola sp.]MDH4289435.1 hypothetical protein [Aquincola sp.]MDH5331261.1 hypothetical protein [Aquincola sp.]